MTAINRLFALFMKGFILFYRYTFSSILGRQCCFQPTCSAYALEAIEKHGPWKGGWLAMRRIGSCHPWNNRSGYDPVP